VGCLLLDEGHNMKKTTRNHRKMITVLFKPKTKAIDVYHQLVLLKSGQRNNEFDAIVQDLIRRSEMYKFLSHNKAEDILDTLDKHIKQYPAGNVRFYLPISVWESDASDTSKIAWQHLKKEFQSELSAKPDYQLINIVTAPIENFDYNQIQNYIRKNPLLNQLPLDQLSFCIKIWVKTNTYDTIINALSEIDRNLVASKIDHFSTDMTDAISRYEDAKHQISKEMNIPIEQINKSIDKGFFTLYFIKEVVGIPANQFLSVECRHFLLNMQEMDNLKMTKDARLFTTFQFQLTNDTLISSRYGCYIMNIPFNEGVEDLKKIDEIF
jgi:hypothetical protein